MLACSKAPDGLAPSMAKKRAGRLVESEVAESVSDDSILQVPKSAIRPWHERSWGCSEGVDGKFVWRLEGVAEL